MSQPKPEAIGMAAVFRDRVRPDRLIAHRHGDRHMLQDQRVRDGRHHAQRGVLGAGPSAPECEATLM
jgi:hypothetical protein